MVYSEKAVLADEKLVEQLRQDVAASEQEVEALWASRRRWAFACVIFATLAVTMAAWLYLLLAAR